MRQKCHWAMFFAFSMSMCVSRVASPAEPWLEQPPPSIGPVHDWTIIPTDNFFEVPASRLSTAEFWLADSASLVQKDASYFGRADFKCSTNLYLVRASYGNGGTGDFKLFWAAGSVLVVSHVSLGPATNLKKSALIACLPRQPTAIYGFVSGAL